jgi:hypothetical protein
MFSDKKGAEKSMKEERGKVKYENKAMRHGESISIARRASMVGWDGRFLLFVYLLPLFTVVCKNGGLGHGQHWVDIISSFSFLFPFRMIGLWVCDGCVTSFSP